MKIGTYLVKGPGTAEEKLRLVRDLGFDFVCLSKSIFENQGLTPELCDKVGMPFDNIHLTGDRTTLIWAPGEEGEEVCRRYCNEIRMASERGVHTGIVHVTWGTHIQPCGPDEVGFSRYDRIYEAAEKYGFTVCVENSVFPGHVYAVLDRYTGPAFKHCFDSGHHNAFAPNEDYLGKYGSRLAATHIHDNDGAHDLHMLPFDGTIDWDKLADKFASVSYTRNYICAELGGAGVKAFPGLNADEVDRQLRGMGAYGTDRLHAVDGGAEYCMKLSYDEYVGTLYERMKRLADMIDAKAASK